MKDPERYNNRPKNRPKFAATGNAMEPKYRLSPILPGKSDIGPLRDMAQEVISASAGLEGRFARETALALDEKLRLINSYHSNLIEGAQGPPGGWSANSWSKGFSNPNPIARL
jgi:hypothetical protein